MDCSFFGWGFSGFSFILLVFLLFWLFSGARGHRWDRRYDQSSAENILAEKYARGEITEKEYQEKLEFLRKSRQ